MTFTHNLKEPDIRNVAKKLVRVEKPCVAELSTLMDCMKASGTAPASSGVIHGPTPQHRLFSLHDDICVFLKYLDQYKLHWVDA